MKYSGGYQIIDLGDLSTFEDTHGSGDKKIIPNIYERVLNANKPIYFTGEKSSPGLSLSEKDFKSMLLVSALNDGENIVYASLYHVPDDADSLAVSTTILITEDDEVILNQL